jgi:alkanesulfonate monooxygenase SsuD/methylene tetrahydromethanopterin reductase-like flavin-dependent oxidoreductase (luciferase family)
MRLGLGVAAGPDSTELAAVAPGIELLDFECAWCNDSPAGEGLAALAAWAEGSRHIDLGVGVMALDRHEPEAIAQRVRQLGLPRERLLLGVGAGFRSRPLEVIRDGVSELRRLMPGVRVVVAAMGPRMCALGGEIADGVLLNWMTPERTSWGRDRVHEGARAAGRAPTEVTVYGYVRVALGPGAEVRLERESRWYAGTPHYARHFEAMGVDAASVGEAVEAPEDLPARLSRYKGLDVVVVRALSERTPTAVLDIARAAAPALADPTP